MAKHYQVVHMGGIKAFSSGEAKEHQRLYSEKEWQNFDRSKRSTATIDRSRAHLNFEIGKGGKIYPLGTLPPITERYQQRLAESGAVDPNQKLIDDHKEPAYRTVCEIILSGDVDIMRRLAFGDQKVDFGKVSEISPDEIANCPNSHVRRMPNIEEWATDIYDAVARQYGEDNIIGFSVHLDESEPHIHCCITPIYPFEKHYKDGSVKKGNKIKFRETFGGNRDVLGQLHDFFYHEVNCLYGLDRGESVRETGAHHVNKAEYMRTLNRRISEIEETVAQKEKAVKGLTTMISNLEKLRASLSEELDSLKQQLAKGEGDSNSIRASIMTMTSQLCNIEQKLDDKREKLMDIESAIDSYRDIQQKHQEVVESANSKVALAREEVFRYKSDIESIRKGFYIDASIWARAAMMNILLHQFDSQIHPNLRHGSEDIEGTFFDDHRLDRLDDIIDTAAKAFAHGVRNIPDMIFGAVGGQDYVQYSGGGGSSNDKRWDKDKDEDLYGYMCRLLSMSQAKHRYVARRKGGYSR